MRTLLHILVPAVLSASLLAVVTAGASAEPRTVTVYLPDGTPVQVTVDVPEGVPLDQVDLPGSLTPPPPAGGEEGAAPSGEGDATEPTDGKKPDRKGGKKKSGSKRQAAADEPQAQVEAVEKKRKDRRRTKLRHADGKPTLANPTAMDAIPGPTYDLKSVPNSVIRNFRVPPFLLRIYQAAAIQYSVDWEVLAAINEIETAYGTNLNVSSAGAVGWMQFIPSSWRAYGVDANRDGKKDPYNPVDAIFAAGNYLKAAGYKIGNRVAIRRAIWAYNHADWYVDSVLLRAKAIRGGRAIADVLTGLTEGRFPVYARARYADDVSEREAERRANRELSAGRPGSGDGPPSVNIYAKEGSPVVAVNDGEIVRIGRSERLGLHIVLRDVYGNEYTYGGLGRVSKSYPVPKYEALDAETSAKAVPARVPKPAGPASAGRQREKSGGKRGAKSRVRRAASEGTSPRPAVALKPRLFANPSRPNARRAGGADQLLSARSAGFKTFKNYFSRPFGLDPRDVRLKRLRKGSQVIGGTIVGRVGRPDPDRASHVRFEIRPTGGPKINPVPILNGWQLLEKTAIFRASGKNVLTDSGLGLGSILLLPNPLLEKRVLNDKRIEIYPCGRQDIRSGQVNRRVLSVLLYLSESGLKPMVSSLKCGHSYYTSAGGVSHHSSGNAVDIAMVNGVPILGNQEDGSVTDLTIRALLRLQGTLLPDQVISLRDHGGPTFVMGDHHDHIHVGFRPLFGQGGKKGGGIVRVLKAKQWGDLIERLRKIENPVVPTETSKYALPAKKRTKRASDAHRGE